MNAFPKEIIVAGIGTEVGKTVVSAILTERLNADYWKPIQAGDLDNSDTLKVQGWISNPETTFHPEAFKLNHPMSPHAAADLDDVEIHISNFETPKTNNKLVVELAGGLLVPINHRHTNLDLIQHLNLPVILVVNYYLGSINHTLLSIKTLKDNNVNLLGILFNGSPNIASRDIILEMTGCTNLGEIPEMEHINKEEVKSYGRFIQI